MGKSKTREYKHRLDKYYYLARKVGYRSRAAFKLIQLDREHNFLTGATVCIDLCAAPGGWSQVAARYMPAGSTIVAIDLAPIRDIPGVQTLQADITTAKTHARIKRMINGQKADVVLNDGAPNVGASWTTDSSNQLDLCLASLRVSTLFLKRGGFFVTKVFRSKHYDKLIWAFNQFFDEVIPTKPKASRDTSAECFVVCKGFKQPDVVDPKMLDPQYVFADTDNLDKPEPDTSMEVQKSSYEFSSISVSDFLKARKPMDILATANVIEFGEDPIAQAAANHPMTTNEIKILCSDLKVIGRAERKLLYKWRRNLKRALMPEEDEVEEAEELEVGSDEELDAALKELREKKRRAERAERKRKAKLREQLIKRLQKNLRKGTLSGDFLGRPAKKLEPPTVDTEDTLNKTYDQIIDENLEYLSKKRPRIEDDDDDVPVQTPYMFKKPVSLDKDIEDLDEDERKLEAQGWFAQSLFDDSEDDESESLEEELEVKAAKAPKKKADLTEDENEELVPEGESKPKKGVLSKEEFGPMEFSLAKKLQTKKGVEELIDESFNRNMTGEEEGLYSWFVEDERAHSKKYYPPSKDDIAEWKERMKAIDQVSTKRVIEAKARKHAKAVQKIKAAQEHVERIAERDGLDDKSRHRLMLQASQKILKGAKPKPTLVVTKKRDGGKPSIPKHDKNSRVKLVDRRYKKDLRALKAIKEGGNRKPKKRKSVYKNRRK